MWVVCQLLADLVQHTVCSSLFQAPAESVPLALNTNPLSLPHLRLQELASTTPGFVNASVEFDIATLRPTYRLLWGRAGESNALAVAQGLGFSPAVVAQARQVRAGWGEEAGRAE